MFSNLNWMEIALLLLLALFIFGDKLPNILADGLRMLRNLRRMASNATSDLSRELGTDIRVEDLHPRTFLRKHVLNDIDTDALVKPLKGLSEDLRKEAQGIRRDLEDTTRDQNRSQSSRQNRNRRPAEPAEAAAVSESPEPAAEPPSAPRPSYGDVT